MWLIWLITTPALRISCKRAVCVPVVGYGRYNGGLFWLDIRCFGVDTNRLFWGSRRGMLELDLILLPFLENVYPGLEQADKERYWVLLDEEDQDLFAWFLRRENPPTAELQRIVDIVRANTGLQSR